MATTQDMVGKEVRIYPTDTHKKQGIIESVEAHGVLFKITKSETAAYAVGTLHFIAFSSNLSFAEIK